MLHAVVVFVLVAFVSSWGVATPAALEPSPQEYGILQQVELRNNTHNLVLGWRQYGDRLLFRETIKKGYRFGALVMEDLWYPPRGIQANDTITHIVAVDHNGGYANVTAGGIGQKSVRLLFKSKRSRSIKFAVQIYGQ